MPESPHDVVLPASGEGRLGNVSGALLLGDAALDPDLVVESALGLTRLCHEVVLVGGAPPALAPGRRVPEVEGPQGPLRALVSALEACRSERVLVVVASRSPISSDLLLALTVFPNEAVVLPRDASGVYSSCAIFGREAVLPAAREQLARGEIALADWIDTLGPHFLEGAELAQLVSEEALSGP